MIVIKHRHEKQQDFIGDIQIGKMPPTLKPIIFTAYTIIEAFFANYHVKQKNKAHEIGQMIGCHSLRLVR